MTETTSQARPLRGWGALLGWVVLPLLAGYLLSLVLVPRPRVAVVTLREEIWSGSAQAVSAMLQRAQGDDSIRAVVLDIDSPGGGAASSEDLYLQVLDVREHKPVVASITSMGASGAYYLAVAADLIYAKSSSDVGNVGVVSALPPDSFVDEDLMFTGPFKLFGSPRDSSMRRMDMLKQSFLAAVAAQRADRLRIDRATLSRGELYSGITALRLGLIDELGSTADAVARAAEMARIARYDTVDLAE